MARDIEDVRKTRTLIRARRALVDLVYGRRETESSELTVAQATQFLLERPRRARRQTRRERKLNAVEGRQFVYVIGAPRGPVKIGYARDVRQRLRELQVGSHLPLRIHVAVSVADGRGPELEARCHRALEAYRLRGEWFDLVPAVACYEVERLAGRGARKCSAWTSAPISRR